MTTTHKFPSLGRVLDDVDLVGVGEVVGEGGQVAHNVVGAEHTPPRLAPAPQLHNLVNVLRGSLVLLPLHVLDNLILPHG